MATVDLVSSGAVDAATGALTSVASPVRPWLAALGPLVHPLTGRDSLRSPPLVHIALATDQPVDPIDEVVTRTAAALLAAAADEHGSDSSADIVDAMVAGVVQTSEEPILIVTVVEFHRLGVSVET